MKTAHQNLVLLAVAAGLFTLLLVDERRQQAVLAKAIERQPPLTTLDANAVRHIRLGNPGSPDIVLEKTGSGWQLREPVAMPADLVQVGSLTALLAMETRGSLAEDQARRADLGLDPPRGTVRYDDLTLAHGEIEPLKQARYVELEPGSERRRIRLVDAFPPEPFDGEYTDLINKALLPFDAEPLAIEVPGLRLARDHIGAPWQAAPASAQATPAAIAALVEAWRTLRAQATLPPLADTDPKARADVRVQLADGSAIGYRLLDRGEARYLQRLDVPVSYQFLPADAGRLLQLQPESASPAAP